MGRHDRRQAFLDDTLPHAPVVHAIARRNARSAEQAEDVVQETYLRAYAAYDAYRGDGARSWLATICVNVLREQARRAASRPVELLGGDLPEPAAADEPYERVAARDTRARIGAALDTLSSEQREALVLVDVAALSFGEAAEVLGCPRGTVLARVHRGRQRLARLLVSAEATR